MSAGARDIAADLLEALKALKACQLEMLKLACSGNDSFVPTAAYAEACRVLAKYPNLK